MSLRDTFSLRHPTTEPESRRGRVHADFVTTLQAQARAAGRAFDGNAAWTAFGNGLAERMTNRFWDGGIEEIEIAAEIEDHAARLIRDRYRSGTWTYKL